MLERLRRFIDSFYSVSGNSRPDHFDTIEDEQAYEEDLQKARDSFERENSHVPIEEYYETPSEVILKVISTHRKALNDILSHDELLDCYVADLETRVPYYKTRKQLFNWLNRFPGARASMDKTREEIARQIEDQDSPTSS